MPFDITQSAHNGGPTVAVLKTPPTIPLVLSCVVCDFSLLARLSPNTLSKRPKAQTPISATSVMKSNISEAFFGETWCMFL
jgi:hypothetical protein